MPQLDSHYHPTIHLAEDDHWWFHSRTMALLAALDPLTQPDGLVLDIGSGAGNMVHHLSRYGRVIGVDNSLVPLRIAWQRGYTSLPADATALPFANDSFSLVALLDIIEHCEDDLAVLKESWRVCAPSGHIVITTPAFSWLWSYNDILNQHQRRYTKAGLRSMLEQAGFTVLRLSYTYFLVFPAAAGLLALRRILGAKPSIATPDEQDQYQVEMEPVPHLANVALTKVGDWEATLLRRFDLPVGTALLAVAQKQC